MKYKNDYYFIYLTKNIVNNKCYIGQHTTNNLNDGYTGSGKLIEYSINKYGLDNHITGIIEFCTGDNISEKEIFWITKKNTINPNGYNLTKGGEGGDTYALLSEEDKKKFREKSSKNNKGRKRSEETKRKMSEARKGHSWNAGIPKCEETKQKMTEAWKIRRLTPVSEETKGRISQSQMGHTRHTEEGKERISIANSQREWKQESKDKISKANKGNKWTEEMKANLRKKYKCIHCGRKMNKSNLTRYHNDNCKTIT